MDLKYTGCEGEHWVHLSHNRYYEHAKDISDYRRHVQFVRSVTDY